MPIAVRVCPIVREGDGLAMSSRNAYLTPAERARAVCLWQSLKIAEAMHAAGETDVEKIRRRMLAHIAGVDGVEMEYIAFLRDGTVEEVATIAGPTLVAMAARVGRTRLIDNHMIG